MKKFFSFMLAFCMIIPCVFMLSACSHEHTFAETWTFNDTHHWHASTCEHSAEKKDYAEHVDENEDDICDVCKHGQVATIGEVGYTSLESAVDAIQTGEEIVLFADIDLSTKITISKEVKINLNNKKLTVTQDTAGDGVFMVVAGGDLTINGDGEVNGVGNNKWNIAIYAYGGNVTINGGTYTNVGAVDTGSENGGDTHFDLIYVKNSGTVTINGGTFKGQTPAWLLNSHDTSTGTIIVKGGTYYGFDPSNNNTEGAGTNWVANGYEVVENDGVYTVVEE